VERTAPDFLKPSIPTIAGPLIRIVGERVPSPVKAALLLSLTTLLSHVPQYVRPFFPQLQRTFTKNVSEPSSLLVRNRATEGLGVLMGLQPRVDPVVTELLNASRSVDGEVRDSVVGALAAVVKSGGKSITGPIKSSLVDFLENSFAEGGQRGDSFSFVTRLSCLSLLFPSGRRRIGLTLSIHKQSYRVSTWLAYSLGSRSMNPISSRPYPGVQTSVVDLCPIEGC
jgi:hypothetical protein